MQGSVRPLHTLRVGMLKIVGAYEHSGGSEEFCKEYFLNAKVDLFRVFFFGLTPLSGSQGSSPAARTAH